MLHSTFGLHCHLTYVVPVLHHKDSDMKCTLFLKCQHVLPLRRCRNVVDYGKFGENGGEPYTKGGTALNKLRVTVWETSTP